MSPAAPDVAVIGGGAIGVSAAYELARGGARVTLLEAGPDVAAGCSSGNAGLLCPSHAIPLATRGALLDGLRWSFRADAPFALRPRAALLPWLARFAAACTPARERASTDLLRTLCTESLALHAALAGSLGTGAERRGTLNVYANERSFAHGRAEAAEHAAAGLRAEVLDGAAAHIAEPALAGDVAGAVYYPDELSGDPLAYVQALAAAARAEGAELRTGTRVDGLVASNGRIETLATSDGPLTVGTVVLAAGVWSAGLARGLGLRLPVQSGKGYHVDFEAAPATDPAVPIFLHEQRVVLTPLPGRLRAAGMLELVGLDERVDGRRVQAVRTAAERGVRGIAGRRAVDVWAGLRPCTPDGLPIVGRPRRWSNLVVATGHAMLGFTLAPLAGRHVAALVGGEEPDGIAGLSPDRF